MGKITITEKQEAIIRRLNDPLYCHPYSAYERGSNENMNRIIRRFFPKGTNFDDVTAAEVAEVSEWLANYPRRILGWATPQMLFEQYTT